MAPFIFMEKIILESAKWKNIRITKQPRAKLSQLNCEVKWFHSFVLINKKLIQTLPAVANARYTINLQKAISLNLRDTAYAITRTNALTNAQR
ncbi:MAG: hypothetical protein JW806_04510 [Sedimentisphaerales bacterium]|nr:hypothetical protein [Sedimentisphaerales bacterium]